MLMLIERPTTLAQKIVNVVTSDIYERSGGDWFFDRLDPDIREQVAAELTEKVQRLIDVERTGERQDIF